MDGSITAPSKAWRRQQLKRKNCCWRFHRKVAVIGTISDSSGDAAQKYKKVCRQIRDIADLVVFVGTHAHRALRARKDESDTAIQGFPSIRDAATYLQSELKRGDLVLLKGSHRADHLVRLIVNRTGPIQCWKDKCDLQIFCDTCPELYKTSTHILGRFC